MRRATSALLHACAALLLIAPGDAEAINCRIWVVPANFGTYIPARPTHLDRNGLMTVRCVGRPGSFTVVMGPGNSGNQVDRKLFSGPVNTLDYNLFVDAARTRVWGDGTPPTSIRSGVRNRRGRPNWYFYPFYARAFANQTPNAGVYVDNVVVTVLF